MADNMDVAIVAALASALLNAADAQKTDYRIESDLLPRGYFEKAAKCTAAEVAAGFKHLDLRFINHGGDIVFNRDTLNTAAKMTVG